MQSNSSNLGTTEAGLFGLVHSNRDFSQKKAWGKNQFNSAFPAALLCYMGHSNIEPVYLIAGNNTVSHSTIPVEKVLHLPYNSPDLHWGFETAYQTHLPFVIGGLPRADLVISNIKVSPPQPLTALEVKLTTLPDSATLRLDESRYGTEIVVRPDTIVSLALEMARRFANDRSMLRKTMEPDCDQIAEGEWLDATFMLEKSSRMIALIEHLVSLQTADQMPLLMQPIRKTVGATGVLADQCFDIFIWSDCGFASLLIAIAKKERKSITRQTRSVFWLVKMFWDFALQGQIDYRETLDKMVFGTKNDKAFAVSGTVTQPFMKCEMLEHPRIPKEAAREIILNGGEQFLSPERRLDAAIVNSGLFDARIVASESLSESEASDLEAASMMVNHDTDAND